MSRYFKCRNIFFASSGTTILYCILKTLKRVLPKSEIILPAFTAPKIIAAVNKAGLRVRLIDISLETFNMDISRIDEVLTEQTLAIIPVHMFGLGCDINSIARIIQGRDIFIIEDFAQAMGTTLGSARAGTLSSISFTSLGRGKNFPLYSGGIGVIKEQRISEILAEEFEKLYTPHILENVQNFLKMSLFSLISNPRIYSLLHRFIRALDPGRSPHKFKMSGIAEFQTKVGIYLFKRFKCLAKDRNNKGMLLYEGLMGVRGVKLPALLKDSIPVFNRFPVLFEDRYKRDEVAEELSRIGIESLPIYDSPIHRIYTDLNLDMGRYADPFPNASYFASRHLCLPVHHTLTGEDIDKILKTFRKIL